MAKIGPISTVPDDVRARFMDMLGDFSTPVSFATVFLLALALWLLFRRRRPLLGEHAVFSMDFFSFVLLWSLWSVPFPELGG